jgi:Flp pilus assembly protein TadG
MALGRRRRRSEDDRGQSVIEFALIIPVFMVLLLGMLEFGFLFSHHLTLTYATREGARTGATLANGSREVACDTDPNVDDYVIAAVQRVLTSPGSQVPLGQVSQIAIYRASSTGDELATNLWVPGTSTTSVDGQALRFVRSGGTNWNPCTRNNSSSGSGPDSIGVRITYNYIFTTPLGTMTGISGSNRLTVTDRSVMALNPE